VRKVSVSDAEGKETNGSNKSSPPSEEKSESASILCELESLKAKC
jgi:hypothetical protein